MTVKVTDRCVGCNEFDLDFVSNLILESDLVIVCTDFTSTVPYGI